MNATLVPCPACQRHVFSSDVQCPFCAAPVEPVARSVPPARLSRAAQIAWRITLGGASVAACASPAVPKGPDIAVESDGGATARSETPSDGGIAVADSAVAKDADAAVEDPRAREPRHVVAIYGSTIVIVQEAILFAPGSDVLSKAQDATLDAVAEIMKERPELHILVEGNASADEPGPKKLSEARARRVGAALVKRGIAKDRLRTVGYGASRPVAPPGPEAKQNRAVRMRVDDPATDAGAPLP